jgi:hypothetical protein
MTSWHAGGRATTVDEIDFPALAAINTPTQRLMAKKSRRSGNRLQVNFTKNDERAKGS